MLTRPASAATPLTCTAKERTNKDVRIVRQQGQEDQKMEEAVEAAEVRTPSPRYDPAGEGFRQGRQAQRVDLDSIF